MQRIKGIKGAIDRSIAEEQARQEQARLKAADTQKASSSEPSASARRSASTSRTRSGSNASTQSPVRRPRPRKASEVKDSNGDGAANPDPAVFEAAFVIDDTDEAATPARVATPLPTDDDTTKKAGKPADTAPTTGEIQSQTNGQQDHDATKSAVAALPASPAELSPEIQAKLRKLEKLEKQYPELLRSYRIAHSRATSIEPFEKALKEHTPLTSIKDTEALVEYLTQVNVKGDMVMQELKRVSVEKDTYKNNADEADKELAALKEEVAALKAEKASSAATKPSEEKAEGQAKDGEDFFSYDTEIPQLQAEVDKKSAEIHTLQTNVQNLKEELALARENSSSLVESLEKTTRELSESKDAVAVKAAVETQLEARKAEIVSLTERLDKSQARVKVLEIQLEKEKEHGAAAAKDNSAKMATYEAQITQLQADLEGAAGDKSSLSKKIARLAAEVDELRRSAAMDEVKIIDLTKKLQSIPPPPTPTTPTPTASEGTHLAPPAAGGGGKKKNKKKKKGGASASTPTALELTPSEADTGDQEAPSSLPASPMLAKNVELQAEVDQLKAELAEKLEQIERIDKKRHTEEELREEIENLRENMMLIGNNHVEAKDKIKALEAEKKALRERIAELEKEFETSAAAAKNNSKLAGEHESLRQEFEDLKTKSSTLQSDLAAAQQLAQARYKDLTDLREVLQKAQPELKSLRLESAALKTTREELNAKSAELRGLEKREKELKMELVRTQRLASDREAEIKSLHDRISTETNTRLRLEDEKRIAGRDLRRSEAEKIELSAREEKTSRELQRIQDESSKLRPRIKELEDEVSRLKKQHEVLSEDAELKKSQYASAQSLLGSMRDQTAEVSIQLKESQAQCESLDEELAETRKMLGERTREAETMRRLLQDVDERAEGKVREMKARMDQAIEERDRLEDESSALARRRARETEDLRQRIRDLEREIKSLATEKDDLEHKEREWRRRREELESVEERADAEINEMRTTVSNLRTTLDASEQQARNAENKNAELRKGLDDYRVRYDKLSKETKALQAKLALSATSAASTSSLGITSASSVRSSIDDSYSIRSGVNGSSTPHPASQDAMYLKTILLQFLEQKDNRLRAQLVPVLGKLLGFEKADEQKWLAAIQHLNRK
ncbi:hypothetical protein B0H63DRAFT_401367 [Podospora didyma]|uniref:GRIP domain-containing protein n=1 Tax=Podospora didyma TaxID=330526 RepID=A0AAE0N5Y9_9PEZI|nr:hypothetical protein B0H63DRAFT_401367 [Podospora didyma]